jgi:hypothetical protein
MQRLFPQRRMVGHYHERQARYLRAAEAVRDAVLADKFLALAAEAEADAEQESRACCAAGI